jgi:hypothetical protein
MIAQQLPIPLLWLQCHVEPKAARPSRHSLFGSSRDQAIGTLDRESAWLPGNVSTTPRLKPGACLPTLKSGGIRRGGIPMSAATGRSVAGGHSTLPSPWPCGYDPDPPRVLWRSGHFLARHPLAKPAPRLLPKTLQRVDRRPPSQNCRAPRAPRRRWRTTRLGEEACSACTAQPPEARSFGNRSDPKTTTLAFAAAPHDRGLSNPRHRHRAVRAKISAKPPSIRNPA